MAELSLLSPLDQPLSNHRLIDDLKDTLDTNAIYTDLRIAVAYAKSGVISRLEDELRNWIAAGNNITAYIGIDQKVTSKEALILANEIFNNVYIINHKSVTFHPKVYAFKGEESGKVILGSNNLTSGGLETNFEAAVIIAYDLTNSNDSSAFNEYWNSLSDLNNTAHGISAPLTKDLIDQLDKNNLLSNEVRTPGEITTSTPYQPRDAFLNTIFESKFTVAQPKRTVKKKAAAKKNAVKKKIKRASALDENKEVLDHSNEDFESFIIQIKPHHNGEIFLSKTAVNENPDFFGYPFSGSTTPKNPANPSYPQLDPDPIVNILVYGEESKLLISINDYPLNTVYYSTKSEIRITCSQIVDFAPEYSVLIMSKPKNKSSVDYEMVIHTPDSPFYDEWVAKCPNKMPGGGKAPRAYGWL